MLNLVPENRFFLIESKNIAVAARNFVALGVCPVSDVVSAKSEYMERPNVCWTTYLVKLLTTYSSRMVDISVESVD